MPGHADATAAGIQVNPQEGKVWTKDRMVHYFIMSRVNCSGLNSGSNFTSLK
jgi:hypothetical protein